MQAGRADLEELLDQVRLRCSDPTAGPWGPRSVMWRLAREKGVFLAGGRAALLQLAHPYVGEAVAASENAVRDPALRFRRTFEALYAMVFGTLDQVLAAARRVHQVHAGVGGVLPAAGRWPEGHRYAANEPHALRWVLATLVDGSVLAHEAVLGPLAPEERERFWQESRELGLLMGLVDLPPDWASFDRYYQGMLASDALAVTPAAAEVGRRLLIGPDRVTAPLWASYRAITSALLPERFRAPFGLRWGKRERALSGATLAAIRIGYPLVPAQVRCVPAWREASWRVGGSPRRVDRLGRSLEALTVGVLLRPGR